MYFLQSQICRVCFRSKFAVNHNLLVAAQSVGGHTGVVAEAVVLYVRESEAVQVPGLLHGHVRPGGELSLHEEPGDTGLRLPAHLAADDDLVAGAGGDALSLDSDDRGVCTGWQSVGPRLSLLSRLTLNYEVDVGRGRLPHPVVGRAGVEAGVRPGHTAHRQAAGGGARRVWAVWQLRATSGPDHGGLGVTRHRALHHHLLPLLDCHLGHGLHPRRHWTR